jgi:flavoprotein
MRTDGMAAVEIKNAKAEIKKANKILLEVDIKGSAVWREPRDKTVLCRYCNKPVEADSRLAKLETCKACAEMDEVGNREQVKKGKKGA